MRKVKRTLLEKTKKRLLIVDDERELVAITKKYFEYEGFLVSTAFTGLEALRKIDDTYDIVILDISMPNMDGMEVCRKIRRHFDLPIVFLTAKSEEEDLIEAFRLGADDYITKPVTLPVLMSHVKAAIRRYRHLFHNKRDIVYSTTNFSFNRTKYDVLYKGKKVPLTKIEFSIMLFLAENPNKVKSICEIYENVWEEDYCKTYANTVMVHINNIKTKLIKVTRSDQFIKNVWGKGYNFNDFLEEKISKKKS
ncbi:MAG: response regulator transcription factor [Caldisericia bacterium]|nr:response regulator transcription factor [Caldisericia bacterium]MDD4615185.1 response regulator transcription factor [Caldisericia bacterium]